MTEFTIAYDLHGVKDRSIYDSISTDILTAYKAVKVLNTTFFVVGNHTCESLYLEIRRILIKYVPNDDNFEIVVVQFADFKNWLNRSKIDKHNAIRTS